jgi:hypothetical protein
VDALLALVRQRRAELEAARARQTEAEVADITDEMRARALAAFLTEMSLKAEVGKLDTDDMSRLNTFASFLAEQQPGPDVTAMTDIIVGIVANAEFDAAPNSLGDTGISNATRASHSPPIVASAEPEETPIVAARRALLEAGRAAQAVVADHAAVTFLASKLRGLADAVEAEAARPSLTPFATTRALPSLVRARISSRFELGQAAEHSEHEATVRRRRVGPCVAE